MSTANMPPDLKSLLDAITDPIIRGVDEAKATGNVQASEEAFRGTEARQAEFWRVALAQRRIELGAA